MRDNYPHIKGSQAFIRFNVSFRRTKLLKDIALAELTNRIDQITGLLRKISNAEEIASTDEASDYGNEVIIDETGNQLTRVTLTENELNFLHDTMDFSHKEHVILDTYLYSVLIVFIWGAFETYNSSLFKELFTIKPEMLKSNETVKYDELLSNLDNPIKLLIGKELAKIGHFKLKELLNYLDSKLNVKMDNSIVEKLHEIYLVRNIIAHNTGFVRDEFLQSIPTNIKTIDNEIIVTEEYFEEAIVHIRDAVELIEAKVKKSFFINTAN
ncbi:hypothetical protein [Paenibacillus oleatilyticus]|uniref:RiboL-PSP-HEPN domain-containing protein n=1 Tax=Paenibacillus oleatilyticus TaxID=2594886 RepID=A0ABV4V8P6_9BACL